MTATQSEFVSAGARALAQLHAQELLAFLATWKRFCASGLGLPSTDDPSYTSNGELLRHVLRAARGYMTWTATNLKLPDPAIDATPEASVLLADPDTYTEHVLARWPLPLAAVTDDMLEPQVYPARWGPPYTVDAMLEHAVMHPLRHRHQLERLMGETG